MPIFRSDQDNAGTMPPQNSTFVMTKAFFVEHTFHYGTIPPPLDALHYVIHAQLFPIRLLYAPLTRRHNNLVTNWLALKQLPRPRCAEPNPAAAWVAMTLFGVVSLVSLAFTWWHRPRARFLYILPLTGVIEIVGYATRVASVDMLSMHMYIVTRFSSSSLRSVR